MSTPEYPTPLIADREALDRIFIRPEDDSSRQTLVKYMEQILFGLHDFLNRHVGVTEEISLVELAQCYTETRISREPEKKLADVIEDIINEIAPRAVNVASPYFIGHMTAAIPFFMVHLKAITAALNQNVIKLETSKVLSILEKQVLAKIHRTIYKFDSKFYNRHVQNTDTSLGAFCAGGTTANLTALWVARNSCLPPKGDFQGVESDGLFAAMAAHGLERLVVLVSKRGHYSLKKAGGVLGIGNANVLPVEVDEHRRVDLDCLEAKIKELEARPKTKVIAVVGVAGATETGVVDPLPEMARICKDHQIHFHVDAAWGGPVLFSEKYAHKLAGIELADSVTIDCHKQFYMPMGSGMIYFKDPTAQDKIAYHARYIIRKGSVDLGIKTLEGSREANSLVLDSALKIMGTRGYGLMIDHGIETAMEFARKIKARPQFQLISPPELNILAYRAVPESLGKKLDQAQTEAEWRAVNQELDEVNINLQRIQREAGKSFVSRTRLKAHPTDPDNVVVLRSVIMNPYTTPEILDDILDEQESILKELAP